MSSNPKKTRNSPAKAGTGSPNSGEPVYLVIGRLRRPHGLHGEMLMEVITDFPERLQPGVRIYVGVQHQPMVIAGRRAHAQGLLLTFEGLEVREEVGQHRSQYVYVLAADRPPLPEGEYYHHQLVGLKVVDENGGILGELNEILETGANDVYSIKRPDGNEFLIPAIPSVVLEVDLSRAEMRVRLPPGLLDEE
jgi:16S rRNA processing protein RimM